MTGKSGVSLTTNVPRRVDNLPLRKEKDVYWPIFEAISNAFDAIDEAKVDKAEIEVRIIRDDSQIETIPSNRERRVADIIIKDNGCGFNEDNFKSFIELDSERKRMWGGKGVGRLYWLKTFDEVKIQSIHRDGKKYRRRSFNFRLPNGVEDIDTSETTTAKTGTTIKLIGYRKEFEAYFRRKRLTTLKSEILKHFMPNLILRGDFSIHLQDGDDIETIMPTDIPAVSKAEFKIDKEKFEVLHMRASSVDPEGHYIYYSAGKRVVGSPEKVSSTIGLPRKATKLGSDDNQFYYVGFVVSDFLTRNVNQERTRFAIEDSLPENNLIEGKLITFEDIRRRVNECVSDFLESNIESLEQEKEARIDEVFSSDLAGFGYLKDKNPELFESLSVDATTDEIKERAAMAHFKNRRTSQHDIEELIQRVSEGKEDANQFQEDCITKLPALLDVHKADLAQHVQFRAYVLRLLNKVLSKTSEDVHYLEKSFHSLIFPMQVSEEKQKPASFSVHNHQLWLFDDRFSFYDFLASDQQLKKHETLADSESIDRPDICVYLFSEDLTHTPYNSVVIVELKRPGRTAHDEDPVKQAFRYIDEIKKRIKDFRGQEVVIDKKTTQFYCYIVCDTMTDYIQEEVAIDHQMIPLRGGGGFFMYHSKRNAYIELMSPKALLTAAYERNLSFFRKLGLSENILKL